MFLVDLDSTNIFFGVFGKIPLIEYHGQYFRDLTSICRMHVNAITAVTFT